MLSRAFWAVMLVGTAWLLCAMRANGQDAAFQREIDEAIDRGVAHLRGLQDPKDGHWARKYTETGSTALAAWTLLECGAAANDPAVQKAANVLRAECIGCLHTYSVAVAIMFFDRLGDPVDEPLIQSLALRLMSSQGKAGGWHYDLLAPPDSEVARLTQHYKQVPANKGAREPAAGKPGDATQLAPEIRLQLARLFQQGLVINDPGDNSNTQLAMLALWVARRHGMPVDWSLALVERHFRETQNQLGCWWYQADTAPLDQQVLRQRVGSLTAMTCAGVLALALTHPADAKGVKKAARSDLTRDPQVRAGLAAVAALIGTPETDRRKVAKLVAGDGYRVFGRDQGCYCLWTLERMAVVYDLKTIGNKDWYIWGAQILVGNQQPDGRWESDCPQGGCDTCFALLFLKRANVARDLTATLKGKVRDPGKASPPLLMMIGKEDISVHKGSGSRVRDSSPAVIDNSRARQTSGLPEDAAKLSNEFLEAAPAQREALLEKLRDTPGPAYTQALADAIPKLRGTAKTKARLALAQRFEHLDAEALHVHLRAAEPEMRRAAAVAAGAKKSRDLSPDLIRLLEDHEVSVLQAARAALREISGQDFGPELDATPAQRTAAVDAWRKWWKQQK